MNDERLLDLLLRWEEEAERGRPVSAEDLCRDCPELVGPLKAKIEALGKTAWMTRPVGDADEGTPVGASPSRVLAERYRLEALLGEGGFGQVWRAFDTVLHRHVAVKIPKPSRPLAPAQVELFLAEARKLAALDIPGVVPVFDVRAEGAGYFIVTRLVPGADLGRCLERGRFSSPAEVAGLVARVARTLASAHARGYVHRDLKPSNILVDEAGQPHLCDFGIAATERELLEGQVRPGTLAYSSPEEVRGGPVDARTDTWSLGVVLYQALSGRLPFDGDNPAAVRGAILSGAHPPLRSTAAAVTPALAAACKRCLAPAPEDRFSSAEALADALDGAVVHPARKYRGWVIGLLAVIFLVALGAWLNWPRWGGQSPAQSGVSDPIPGSDAPPGVVSALCFSPDGKLLASGSADAKVRLWEVREDLHQVAVLDQIAGVRSLLFSKVGKLLLAGCDNGSCRCWDLSQAKPMEGLVVPGHTGPVNSMASSADGKILVTGGEDGTVRIYLDPGPKTSAAVIPRAGARICSVTLTPKADKLLVGVGNGPKEAATLDLWDIHPGDKEPRLTSVGRAVLGTVDDARVIAASPGRGLIVAATGRKAYVWSEMRVVGSFDQHPGTITSVVMATDQKHVLTCDEEGDVIAWAARDLRVVHRRKDGGVRSVAVSPDGTLVALGGADGSVRLWRLPSPLR